MLARTSRSGEGSGSSSITAARRYTTLRARAAARSAPGVVRHNTPRNTPIRPGRWGRPDWAWGDEVTHRRARPVVDHHGPLLQAAEHVQPVHLPAPLSPGPAAVPGAAGSCAAARAGGAGAR